ncbi:MAG: ligase-associated DNA damage response exonuclease [Lishizhenia sp.]
MKVPLLQFTDKGIYCKQADVYIDPWKPVDYALITHGHADHARWGSKKYLCHPLTKKIIEFRLGKINCQTVQYNKTVKINGVSFSFHPAGHVIGSAQIRVEYKGEVWVASGDYKVEYDGISQEFEPVKCHTFITECTFGLPVFKWKPQKEVFENINAWWKQNNSEGKASLLFGYSLGKAQRLLQNIDTSIGEVYTHAAVENINDLFREEGVLLPNTIRITKDTSKDAFNGNLIIAPPGAMGSSWTKKMQPFSTGVTSGWMNLRGARRRRGADRGFVLSDHADWDGLLSAIKSTEAENIITTHGYTSVFTAYLNSIGYNATVESTEFEGELFDEKDKDEIE